MHEMYLPHPPVAHGCFIRGVYAGRLALNARAISVSNWLAGTHVSFKVTKVKESVIYMTLSLTVLQPESETFPFATFTDTEVFK